MDVFPKFIIETDDELGDCLIICKSTYHSDLVTNKEKVKGGGWFNFKDETFTLFGESHEFGKATIEDIKQCIENGNVFSNPSVVYSISGKYNFKYNTGTEIIEL